VGGVAHEKEIVATLELMDLSSTSKVNQFKQASNHAG
jgi:hypothetical protein